MTDFDPAKIYVEVVSAGEDWADKKSAYEALDGATKSVLAEVTGKYLPVSKTRIEAEMVALASQEYRSHLEAVNAARKDFLLAQVKYNGLTMLAELRRTQESTRRAEMRL